MLRNLIRRAASGKLIAGTPQIGIIASQILSETATGDNGPGLLYDESLAQTGRQLRVKVTSWTGTAGTLSVSENGAILIEGQADGAYSIGYDWEAWTASGGLNSGSDTASVAIGAVHATAEGGTGASAGAGTGGEASGATSVSENGGTGTGSGSGSGGDAIGDAVGDAAAASGTGTSTGYGSGGAAAGSAGGISGSLSDEDVARIAAAVLAALQTTAIPVDLRQINGHAVSGSGTETDPWGP